jgi:hypothetical protein
MSVHRLLGPVRALTLSFAVAGLVACSDATGPSSDILRVESSRGRLLLHNLSDDPIYYFAVEQSVTPLLDWIPCTNPGTCPKVSPHAVLQIPFEEIAFYQTNATNAIVYHWRLRSSGGIGINSFTIDSMRAVVVKLE